MSEGVGVEELADLKALRDTYLRDDLTGGMRTVPVKLSDLTALIARVDELADLNRLRERVEDIASYAEDYADLDAMHEVRRMAVAVLAMLDKREGLQTRIREEPETTL